MDSENHQRPAAVLERGCFHDAVLDRVGGDENELRLTPGADAFALTQVAESSPQPMTVLANKPMQPYRLPVVPPAARPGCAGRDRRQIGRPEQIAHASAEMRTCGGSDVALCRRARMLEDKRALPPR